MTAILIVQYAFYVYNKKRKGLLILPMTPKQMVKLLKKNGFRKISQNGSHAKFFHPATKRTTIVPMHSKDLDKGLESDILKQASLK